MAAFPETIDVACPVCAAMVTVPLKASGPVIDADGRLGVEVTGDVAPLRAHVRRWHGPRQELPQAA